MIDPRLTETEHAFINAVKHVWPGGLGYPLGSYADRHTEEAVRRLIAADVVERTELAGQRVGDTGEVVDAAMYRLTDDFIGDLGATPRPEDN